ncbi:MAG: hypothetical protein WBF79_01375 [Rhodococcus sp. (in: high G+C Gram-positive bacteria)]
MGSERFRLPPSARTLIKGSVEVALRKRGFIDHTVGLGIPMNWNTDESPPHVQVDGDGTPAIEKGWGRVTPASHRGPVRITVWDRGTTTAERVANILLAMLLVERPPLGISSILPGTGIITDRDPDTGAELASFTLRCTTIPLPI